MLNNDAVLWSKTLDDVGRVHLRAEFHAVAEAVVSVISPPESIVKDTMLKNLRNALYGEILQDLGKIRRTLHEEAYQRESRYAYAMPKTEQSIWALRQKILHILS